METSVQWYGADWNVSSPSGPLTPALPDPMIEQLAFESQSEMEVQEFVAAPRPVRGDSRAPLLATVEPEDEKLYVIAARHSSGAIRFFPPDQVVPRSAAPPTLHFSLAMEPSAPMSRSPHRLVRLFLIAIADQLADAAMPVLARRWEERKFASSELHRGLVPVDRQRLAVGSPFDPLSTGELSTMLKSGRTLLLLHGILSHSEVAFRGLSMPRSGVSFFDDLQAVYGDRIVAFNHFTISETPIENAQALLSSMPPGGPHRLDVVTHSRGGVVFRVASEMAADLGFEGRFAPERVILVAAPNEGSPLASPTRLVHFLNLVANLTEMFPTDPFALGLGFVAEALAWTAKTVPRALPAVGDLAPGSTLIRALQSAPSPTAEMNAIVSNYEPDDAIWKRLVDAGVDEVFGSANDLVVPTEGAWKLDSAPTWVGSGRIGCFGRGGNLRGDDADVIHTNYFLQSETLRILVRTLRGEAPALPPFAPETALPWRPSLRLPAAAARPGETELIAEARGAEPPLGATTNGAAAGADPFHLMLLSDGRSKRSPRYQLVARYRNASVIEEFATRGGAAGKRMNRIIEYHESIRNFVRGKTGARMPDDQELEEYGELLFATLFPHEVRRLYDVARSIDRSRRLDVVFLSTLDWIADKPWEFARDPYGGTWIAASDVNFSRNVFTPVPSERIRPGTEPLRILVVSAQPLATGLLSIEDEEEVIASGFRPLVDEGLAEIRILRGATVELLHRHVETSAWDVIHFIGHGEYDHETRTGYLIFENARGAERRVPTSVIQNLLCRHGVKLVFLNACETGRGALADYNQGVAPGLVAAGIPAVVANQYVVLDPSATAFARHFYWSLSRGNSLGDAVREARIALNYQISGAAIDWAVPVLFARDPSERLCTPRAPRFEVDERPRFAAALPRTPTRPTLRLGIWDVNGVMPGLSSLIDRFNGAQSRFELEEVKITAPLGTWRPTIDDGSQAWLDAEEVSRRIRPMVQQAGVDGLFCITTMPLADRTTTNLYLSDDGEQIAIFSVYTVFRKIEADRRLSRDAAILNSLAGVLAGKVAGLDDHDFAGASCPLDFNDPIEVRHLGARMRFDEDCRDKLADAVREGRASSEDLEALDALLALNDSLDIDDDWQEEEFDDRNDE